jgi:malate:Na+ symporter
MGEQTMTPANEPAAATRGGSDFITRWWNLMGIYIGVIPLPTYILLIIVVGGILSSGPVPTEMAMVFSIMLIGSFTLAEIGNRLPYLRNIGAAALLVTFVPSALVYYGLLPMPVTKVVTDFFKSSNIMYMFIAVVIVGSILGMDRSVLIRGFVKIFVPLAAGSIAASIVGVLTGIALGIGAFDTFFFTVAPIIGGVGEGALPLTIGYADILGVPQGDLLAKALPAVMVGNLSAVFLAGSISSYARKRPHLTGYGKLQPSAQEDLATSEDHGTMDVKAIAGAIVTALALYLVGLLSQRLLGLPGPVVMLFLAVVLKLLHAAPPPLQEGAYTVYKFSTTVGAYPILFSFAVALLPFDRLVVGLHPANLITALVTVTTLTATGFAVARWTNLYPIEAAIINLTHSGMGGAGDVAILTASDRMQLMPFAQVATRIGGGIMVIIALFFMGRIV